MLHAPSGGLLVTSASHMPRAVGVLRHAGWPVLADPVAYKAEPGWTINLAEHLLRLERAMHEWLGLVAYHALGRTDTLLPGP